MPRPGRGRGTRSTRSPTVHLFEGFLIETYNHPDDFPVLSDQPRRRPRHATRGATAAERRADLAASTIERTPSPDASLLHLPSHVPPGSSFTKPCTRASMRTRTNRCTICLRGGNKCMLLRCTECSRAVHNFCLNPPRVSGAVAGTWTCITCTNAAATWKKQSVRTFRDAVRNYSYLVPSRYLDSLTESVELAAAAEAAIKSRLRGDQEIDFALPMPAEAPQSRPDDNNTVILKVSATDSDLDDIHVARTPLQNLTRSVKRLSSERESVEHDNGDDAERILKDKRLPESSPKISEENGTHGSVKVAMRVRKRARLSTGPSLDASKARASNSTELSLHVPVPEPDSNAKTASLPSSCSFDSGAEFPPHLVSKIGRRAKSGHVNTKERREVWVQLRCRPPFNEREFSKRKGASTEKSAEINTMVDGGKEIFEVGQVGSDVRERARTKFKESENRQDKDKKKVRAQSEIEAENKAEICRRLAKARAKKAELRKAAMLRKETLSKSTRGEIVMEGKVGASGPVAPNKTARAFSQVGRSAKHEPSALPSCNIASSTRDSVYKRGDIVPTAHDSIVRREVSFNNDSGNGVSNSGEKRSAKNQPLVMAPNGKNINSTETSAPQQVENNPQLSEGGGSTNQRGKCKAIATAVVATPAQRCTIEGNGTKETFNGEIVGAVDLERETAFVHTKVVAQTDICMNNELSPRGETMTNTQVQGKGEAAFHEPAGNVRTGRSHSPTLKVSSQDRKVEQKSISSAVVEEGKDKGYRKAIPIIELDQDSDEDIKGDMDLLPRQRAVSKAETLFQSSVKGVEASVCALPTEWGKMDLDAKNEALLTLAQEQTGRVKRRSTLMNVLSPFDKDVHGRNVKSQSAADNISEGERKRMQVAALVTQEKARNTSASISQDSNRTTVQRGSIGRLLIDPSLSYPPEGHSTVVGGISQPRLAGHLSSLQDNAQDVNSPSLIAAATTVDNSTEIRRGMIPNLNHMVRVPDIHDARAGGIQLIDTTPQETDRISRPVAHGQVSFRDNVSFLDGEIPKSVTRPIAVNPSSRSGSQSDVGSAAALGLTSVYTLKRTRKRPTLASVTKDPVPPQSEGGFDSFRSLSLTSRGNDDTYTGSDRARAPLHDLDQIQQSSGRRRSVLSGRHLAFLGGSLQPRISDKIGGISEAQKNEECEDHNLESPLQFQLFQQKSTKDSLRAGSYGNSDRVDEVVPAGRSASRQDGGEAPNGYSGSPAASNSRLHNTSAQLCRDTSMLPNEYQRNSSQKLFNNEINFVDSPYLGNYSRQVVDDPMMFPEPSRRLKKSVAPTLPTAARRFQYEQGRQLARFTPSTSPSDHPQAHSNLRRRAATQHISDQTLSAHNSNWDICGESHGELLMTPLQSGYTHSLGRNQVLSHEYISQEGVRPQLVPVPPVVYEPEDNVRTRELNVVSNEIPRLHDVCRSHLQSRHPVNESFEKDFYPRDEVNEQTLSRSQHLMQTLSGSRSLMGHLGVMQGSPTKKPQLLTISRAGGDATGEAVGAETYRHCPRSLRRPSSTAFSPLSPAFSHFDQCDNEAADAAGNVQAPQPARTDPSLKNLLT